jgi:hypothetical protein
MSIARLRRSCLVPHPRTDHRPRDRVPLRTLRGLARTMRKALATAAGFFGGKDPDRYPWHRVRVDQISALRADLASRLAPNTAHKPVAAIPGHP